MTPQEQAAVLAYFQSGRGVTYCPPGLAPGYDARQLRLAHFHSWRVKTGWQRLH